MVYLGESDSDNDHTVPTAPGWTHGLIMAFAILQMIIASFILLAYIFNDKFRIHPGNISVGFAASALGLSIIWILNLQNDLVDDETTCAWLGFFSLLTEYCSSFYEIGTLYYFYRYFKVIAKPDRREHEGSGEAFIDIQPTTLLQQLNQRRPSQPKLLEVSIKIANLKPEEIRIDSNDEETKKLQEQMKELMVILKEMNTISNKQQETINQLDDYSKKNLLHMGASSYAALQVQSRIHIFIVIFAIAFVLMPSLTEDLGQDFYGVCAIKWERKKQTTGIILTIVATALSALVCLMILAYFWTKKGIHRSLEKEYKKHKINLTDREGHYVKHLFLYVLCSTLFGLGLAATNIFADSQVDYNSKVTEFCFIIHYLIIALRGILLLFLKLAEPETRKALFETLKSLFNPCIKCFKWIAQNSKKASRVHNNDYQKFIDDPQSNQGR